MTTPKSIKGTQTEKNLVISYVAESTAVTRYTFYAAQAQKENYFPIQKIFEETAANELRHSKVYFKFLEGGSITVPVGVDAGVIGTTAENLAVAAREELEEGSEIAEHFRAIATIEMHHRNRFLRFLKQVQDGTVWKRDKPITWKCLVCGYEYVGTEPPAVCPACDHPREHYMALDDPEDLE